VEGASKTALMVAAYRARASARPRAIMQDPWAARIAGEEGERLARAQDPHYAHMELWIAVRTAYLDAHVATWTSAPHDFRQVVILGAGFDMRAFRLAKGGVRFFEVDHPATLADKLGRIATLGEAPRADHVACDFERESFVDALARAGLDLGAPALVLWEGVTPYLPEAAVRATFRAITERCHPRTILVFDHLLKRVTDPKKDKTSTQTFVDDLGEKVVWGTNDTTPILFEEGFRHARSLSFDEACLTLTGTYDRAREFRFQRIVWASRTALAGIL
jgi:methyltransferase (TIGR00027 family)